MPKVNFTPALNGFHFTNFFVNNIVTLPVYGKITTGGRCGGMSYAALDCYFSNAPVSASTSNDFATTGGVPADGTTLADYIYRRQIESFLVPSAAKFITWSLAPDGPTLFLRGVTRWTKEDEFRKLRAAIDAQKPAPLGLIIATDVNGLAHNHQVVAYGYDFDPASEKITVYIYDNNHPDVEITLTSDRNTPHFKESTGETWRGFFVQDYAPQQPPPAVVAAPTAAVSFAAPVISARPKRLTVTFDGVTVQLAEGQRAGKFALALEANGQTARWPRSGSRTVRNGRHYVIGRSFDVEVADGAPLTVSVTGVDPVLADLPTTDNDAPAAASSQDFTAAQKWGRGSHKEHVTGPLGGYTIEYKIKSRR